MSSIHHTPDGDADPASETPKDNLNNQVGASKAVRTVRRRNGPRWLNKLDLETKKEKAKYFPDWDQLPRMELPTCAAQFHRMAVRNEIMVTERACEAIEKIDFSEDLDGAEVTLVAPRLEELLRDELPLSYWMVWERMRTVHRLQPMPALFALRIRLMYLNNQPFDTVMVCGMEPINHPTLGAVVFVLENHSGGHRFDAVPIGRPEANRTLRSPIHRACQVACIKP